MSQASTAEKFVGLHLGCGKQHKPGWVNVDVLPHVGADIVHNLTVAPWPWPSDSVDRIEGVDFIEHIGWGPDNQDLLCVFMNEAHRVLKTGGSAFFRTPSAEHWPWGAFRDPTHRRYMVSGSFDYWTAGHPTYGHVGQSYGYKPWTVTVALYRPNGRTFFDVTQQPVK